MPNKLKETYINTETGKFVVRDFLERLDASKNNEEINNKTNFLKKIKRKLKRCSRVNYRSYKKGFGKNYG